MQLRSFLSRGKPCVFYQIFPGRYLIFPSIDRIFPEEKIRQNRGENPSPVLSHDRGRYIECYMYIFKTLNNLLYIVSLNIRLY